MMTAKNQKELFVGALVGCVVAAATVLLLTPTSGAKLRKQAANLIAAHPLGKKGARLNGLLNGHSHTQKTKRTVKRKISKKSDL